MLYPRESETREVRDLSGIWKFKQDKHNDGRAAKWYAAPLTGTIPMPVPASYNDITQDAGLRDHIGDVWYEKSFFVPEAWRGKRVALRADSATHHAVMWVNGKKVARHKGGFLPFEADVSRAVRYGAENRVTFVVNNILDWTCLPPGEILTSRRDGMHPKGCRREDYHFDFFNYSGLHRPVRLVVTPRVYIDDVTVVTDTKGKTGVVRYTVAVKGGTRNVRVTLADERNRTVAHAEGTKGTLFVKNAKLWRPGKAYLYTLRMETLQSGGAVEDVYRLPVGIRTVKVTKTRFLINGKPFYFKGCAKHEDMDVKGKGLDEALLVKDFNLIKWLGMNSFRTAHYPYAEEVLNMADREGIVVIDEAPAVGMNFFQNRYSSVFSKQRVGPKTLPHHLDVMRELITRDKNHPCVVLWSVANEPASSEAGAEPYFKKVFAAARTLDPTRPVTFVACDDVARCRVTKFSDVVCVNRYYSWYLDSGRLDLTEYHLEKDLKAWHRRFKKPVLVTEYGADTIEGLHRDPPVMFSEEYQCEMLARFHRVFDRLGFVIGEHVWNFADFATKQDVRRVGGNRKGVFTRQRQPKMAAHLLRRRWRGKG